MDWKLRRGPLRGKRCRQGQASSVTSEGGRAPRRRQARLVRGGGLPAAPFPARDLDDLDAARGQDSEKGIRGAPCPVDLSGNRRVEGELPFLRNPWKRTGSRLGNGGRLVGLPTHETAEIADRFFWQNLVFDVRSRGDFLIRLREGHRNRQDEFNLPA